MTDMVFFSSGISRCFLHANDGLEKSRKGWMDDDVSINECNG